MRTGQGLHQGRLAGAIAADESDDLAWIEVHAHAIDRVDAAVRHPDVTHLDQRCAVLARPCPPSHGRSVAVVASPDRRDIRRIHGLVTCSAAIWCTSHRIDGQDTRVTAAGTEVGLTRPKGRPHHGRDVDDPLRGAPQVDGPGGGADDREEGIS